MLKDSILLIVLLSSVVAAWANPDGSEADTDAESVTEQGIAAAQDDNWSFAYSAFMSQRNKEFSYPIYYLIAVAAARLQDPNTAYRYAKSSNREGESLTPDHDSQRDAILYWSRPVVLGTNVECLLPARSSEPSYCEIDEPDALEKLVKEYFGVRLLDLMLTDEWLEAKERESCEYAGIDFGDPSMPRDTKVRCETRRAFAQYDYQKNPADDWHLDAFSPIGEKAGSQ